MLVRIALFVALAVPAVSLADGFVCSKVEVNPMGDRTVITYKLEIEASGTFRYTRTHEYSDGSTSVSSDPGLSCIISPGDRRIASCDSGIMSAGITARTVQEVAGQPRDVITPLFRVGYPDQWGMPSSAAVFGDADCQAL
jgi:hypothetical protein